MEDVKMNLENFEIITYFQDVNGNKQELNHARDHVFFIDQYNFGESECAKVYSVNTETGERKNYTVELDISNKIRKICRTSNKKIKDIGIDVGINEELKIKNFTISTCRYQFFVIKAFNSDKDIIIELHRNGGFSNQDITKSDYIKFQKEITLDTKGLKTEKENDEDFISFEDVNNKTWVISKKEKDLRISLDIKDKKDKQYYVFDRKYGFFSFSEDREVQCFGLVQSEEAVEEKEIADENESEDHAVDWANKKITKVRESMRALISDVSELAYSQKSIYFARHPNQRSNLYELREILHELVALQVTIEQIDLDKNDE